MRRHLGLMVAVMAAAIVPACQAGSTDRPLDQDRVAVGEELYQQNCASCHKADLSGDPDWKTPNDDGSYPPPPNDSSGHTWHHPDQVLIEIIRGGSDFPQSRMPGFGDRLSDDDIEAILEFFKAHWGPRERAFQRQVTEQANPQE